MSKLGDKQRKFSLMAAKLIVKAYELGYEITLGDAYRSPRVFGMMGEFKGYGSRNSNHKQRLAIDLNLFKDGEYLSSSEDHRELGEYWESLDPDCSWGGNFSAPDGNHYSMKHNGFM